LFLFIWRTLTVLNAKIMYERHSAWCTERKERDMLSAHSEKYGTSGQIFLSSNFPRKVFEVWNRWPRDPSDNVISPSTKGVDPCILRKLGLAIWLCITHIHTYIRVATKAVLRCPPISCISTTNACEQNNGQLSNAANLFTLVSNLHSPNRLA
jgi:hypothetical protein